MDIEKKSFPTLSVLSVTSGRLLTKPKDESEGSGIGQMYDVLGWMTDDSPYTHQLGRFADECRPWIHRWHPDIKEADDLIVSHCESGGSIPSLQADMVQRFGKTIELQKIPRDDHEVKNAFDEMVEMRGTDEGIILVDEQGNVS